MIDIQDLAAHLTDPKIRTDEAGRVCLRAAGRDLALGIAQHAANPARSILGLAVISNAEPMREVFVTADEWAAKLADVAAAVTMPTASIWIGSARARHAELLGELDTARELAAVAAARAWSGAELRDEDESVIVFQGSERTRAALQLSAAAAHELTLIASLGRHVLFTVNATVAEAPSLAVRAVRALQQGERLAASERLQAQRDEQAAFEAAQGLGEFSGSIWAASRLQRTAAKPAPAEAPLLKSCGPRPRRERPQSPRQWRTRSRRSWPRGRSGRDPRTARRRASPR